MLETFAAVSTVSLLLLAPAMAAEPVYDWTGAYVGLSREATLDLDVPQDAVHRLQNGQIDRFDCEPLE